MAYWPDTGTGVDTQPARKPVQSALRKYFTEGGIGQPPTVPGGDWFNQMTNEVLNVVAAAGLTPSKEDDEQLLKSITFLSKAVVSHEALARTYAFYGLNLRPYPESFELGGTLESPDDVLLHEASGKAFSGSGPFPQDVTVGTNPAVGGFKNRSKVIPKKINPITRGADPTGVDESTSAILFADADAVSLGLMLEFTTGTYLSLIHI